MAARPGAAPPSTIGPRQLSHQESQSESGQWILEHFAQDGVNYLLDPRSGVVYKTMTPGSNEYPEPLGRLQPDGRLQLVQRSTAGDLFNALDKFLKEKQVMG